MKRIHSLVALAALSASIAGCSRSDSVKPGPAAKNESSAKEASIPHTHGAGPNGGVVFDLGSHHAEFTVDHTKKECTIVVLGADEKSPTEVKASEFVLVTKETTTADGKPVAPMTITMKPADPADGKATKYVGADPGLGNVADFAGTIAGEIDGKPAAGEFAE